MKLLSRRNTSWLLLLMLTLTFAFSSHSQPLRPRLFVLTDIGGDPDDQQSLIRLMVYANEFEIEGLMASASGTPGELKKEITRPDLIQQIVHAYAEVLPMLKRHASGWPEAGLLLERIKSD